MAKRCEISHEAWDAVSDLLIETRRRGPPRVSDRLMLDGVLWVLCSVVLALKAEHIFRPVTWVLLSISAICAHRYWQK